MQGLGRLLFIPLVCAIQGVWRPAAVVDTFPRFTITNNTIQAELSSGACLASSYRKTGPEGRYACEGLHVLSVGRSLSFRYARDFLYARKYGFHFEIAPSTKNNTYLVRWFVNKKSGAFLLERDLKV